MLRLNVNNVAKCFWDFWQSVTRQPERQRVAFNLVMESHGMGPGDFPAALAAVAKFLNSPDPVLAGQLHTLMTHVSPVLHESRFLGMTEFCALLQTAEPPLVGAPISAIETCVTAFDALARKSRVDWEALEKKVFVVQEGSRHNPFEHTEGSEDPAVIRLEEGSRLNSLAQRIGTHFLKSVWAVLQAGLTEHLSKSLNIPAAKIEASLKAYAVDRGL